MSFELIREDNYKESMDNIVWPYLNERKRELMLPIREGQKLYVCNYHADHPKKMILMSHGFTEVSRKFGEAIYYFLHQDYEVYIVDHCGHGNSYRLTEKTSLVHVDSYKRYVRDLLKAANLAKKEHPDLPFTLFGHSMGGGIAAAAAATKPEYFDQLILSSPMIQALTGSTPYPAAVAIAEAACLAGKAEDYIMGSGPYKGLENFEESASSSRARFDYVQEYKFREPKAQLCAPSYGWMREAGRLSHYLLKEGYKTITMPVALFQAEHDYSVSNEASTTFIEKVKAHGNEAAKRIEIPGAKHEIYNAEDEVAEMYWNMIFQL